ncbi:MAG: TolC family protein, partial [Neisseriaceae bacterium]|nr:TolC family protein [Neisseriaceae bacterium]
MKQLVIALTLTLTACAAVPNAPQDMANIPVPNAWQHASLSDKTIDNLPNRWWEAFDDQELNRLIDTALQQNSSLQKAAYSLQQSLLQVDMATADLLPSVSASANANRRKPLDGNSPVSKSY